jgi:membrane fusion protein (multidrug efflux system)
VVGSVAEIRADETQHGAPPAPNSCAWTPADAELALSQAEARLGAAVRQQRERYANVEQYDAAIEQRRVR